MTAEQPNAVLVRISDGGQTLADPADDVRGRHVRDRNDEDLGVVDELLIDTHERKVRMLRIAHGGLLGVGATRSFVPVEAVTSVEDDVVRIDQTRARVGNAPRYDPDVVEAPVVYAPLYGYYGYPTLGRFL